MTYGLAALWCVLCALGGFTLGAFLWRDPQRAERIEKEAFDRGWRRGVRAGLDEVVVMLTKNCAA